MIKNLKHYYIILFYKQEYWNFYEKQIHHRTKNKRMPIASTLYKYINK